MPRRGSDGEKGARPLTRSMTDETCCQPWGEPPLSFPRSVIRADAAASVPFWIAGGADADAVAMGGAEGGASDVGTFDLAGEERVGRGGGSSGAFPQASASVDPPSPPPPCQLTG